MLSAAGGGALVGAFGLASIKQVRQQGALMIASGWMLSGTLIAFTLSPSLVIGIALLFIAAAAATVFGTNERAG